jgi:hypothetical protein
MNKNNYSKSGFGAKSAIENNEIDKIMRAAITLSLQYSVQL